VDYTSFRYGPSGISGGGDTIDTDLGALLEAARVDPYRVGDWLVRAEDEYGRLLVLGTLRDFGIHTAPAMRGPAPTPEELEADLCAMELRANLRTRGY
jgi:hypothetical protein